MHKTRLEHRYRITLPKPAAQPSTARGRRSWLARFLLGIVATWFGSYAVMHGLDLRFCQPLRMEHMRKVWHFQQEVKSVDVVYLGTSQVHYGVMPELVRSTAKEHGVELGPQYNLAVPGSELELSWIVARDALVGQRMPRMAILGVMPIVVATREDGNPDFVQQYGHLGDVWGRVQDGTLPPTALVGSSFRGVETCLQYPFADLKKPTKQFRADYLERSRGGWFLPDDVAHCRPLSQASWDKHFGRYGKPKALYFDDDNRNARLLRGFQSWATANQIRLVVAYLPQHPDLFHRKWAAGTEERFREWIVPFCGREGLQYVDLSQGNYGPDDFIDPLHLNATGAAKLSRDLAGILIP